LVIEKHHSYVIPEKDLTLSTKHKSTTLDSNSDREGKENLSDKESKAKSKSKFGFNRSKKRSSSSAKKMRLSQMEQDLQAIEIKIGNSENLKNMIQNDYQEKREKFKEAFVQLEELKKFKDEAKNQMCGFLVMYEIKRKHTLQGKQP